MFQNRKPRFSRKLYNCHENSEKVVIYVECYKNFLQCIGFHQFVGVTLSSRFYSVGLQMLFFFLLTRRTLSVTDKLLSCKHAQFPLHSSQHQSWLCNSSNTGLIGETPIGIPKHYRYAQEVISITIALYVSLLFISWDIKSLITHFIHIFYRAGFGKTSQKARLVIISWTLVFIMSR